MVLQVDGKVRGRLTLEVDARRGARAAAWPWPTTRSGRGSQGRAVERVVVVANRLVNIVTRA